MKWCYKITRKNISWIPETLTKKHEYILTCFDSKNWDRAAPELESSESLIDSRCSSRLRLRDKKQSIRKIWLVINKIFDNPSVKSNLHYLPALKKSLSSRWNILNCSIKDSLYSPGFFVILASIASVETKSSGPAFLWSLFCIVCLISCWNVDILA